jgi:hypothetical protein
LTTRDNYKKTSAELTDEKIVENALKSEEGKQEKIRGY